MHDALRPWHIIPVISESPSSIMKTYVSSSIIGTYCSGALMVLTTIAPACHYH